MTDAAESFPTQPISRRFVFTTAEADALALETVRKPADRGWRSLLGYAFALPPLVIISWLTQSAEWPVWFAAFGVVGLASWQGARLVLKAERARAARRHPVGTGEITFSGSSFIGTIGGGAINTQVTVDTRIETDASHLYILPNDQPALILPLSAFADRADMVAFAAALKADGRSSRSRSGKD